MIPNNHDNYCKHDGSQVHKTCNGAWQAYGCSLKRWLLHSTVLTFCSVSPLCTWDIYFKKISKAQDRNGLDKCWCIGSLYIPIDLYVIVSQRRNTTRRLKNTKTCGAFESHSMDWHGHKNDTFSWPFDLSVLDSFFMRILSFTLHKDLQHPIIPCSNFQSILISCFLYNLFVRKGFLFCSTHRQTIPETKPSAFLSAHYSILPLTFSLSLQLKFLSLRGEVFHWHVVTYQVSCLMIPSIRKQIKRDLRLLCRRKKKQKLRTGHINLISHVYKQHKVQIKTSCSMDNISSSFPAFW